MSTWDNGTCRFTPHCLIHDGSRRERATTRRRSLTPEQVAEIRASDEPSSVLQRRYGVSAMTMYRVRNGRTYQDVREG